MLIDISIDILTGKEGGGGGGGRKEGVDFFLKSNDPTPEGGEKYSRNRTKRNTKRKTKGT